MSASPDPIRETERWLLRRGLPQFIEGLSGTRDVWTRAQPFLIVVLVVQLLFLGVVAVLPGGVSKPALMMCGLVGTFLLLGLVSKFRRGYWFAPPEKVGLPFLTLFVFSVPAATLVADPEGGLLWGHALRTLVEQAALLVGVYAVTRLSVFAMLRWGIRETFSHFSDLYNVATKALPLLLVVLIATFLSTEMWQVMGPLSAGWLWASSGMLLALGLAVTFERTRDELRAIDTGHPIELVIEACAGTPMADVVHQVAVPEGRPLRRSQRMNLLVAALAKQFIEAALIGAVIWAFFISFGFVAIPLELQQTWIGDLLTTNTVYLELFSDHVITRALFRVATFMGSFGAFYVMIYSASDKTYREAFSDDDSGLQQAVDVHRVYVAARAQRSR